MEAEDVAAGFQCGKRSLDDSFARHALANDQKGIGCTYVLRREVERSAHPDPGKSGRPAGPVTNVAIASP
jgi:hypothetical protein